MGQDSFHIYKKGYDDTEALKGKGTYSKSLGTCSKAGDRICDLAMRRQHTCWKVRLYQNNPLIRAT